MSPETLTRGAALAAPAPLGETLSPSKAKLWLECSARWWFKYAMGLPDPPRADMVRGIVIHRVVEAYMKAKRAGQTLEADDLAEIFSSAWEAACEGAVFDGADDLGQLQQEAAILARKYLDEAAPEIEPAKIEMPVAGAIGGVHVRGVVDLMDVHGRIIDLKSSGRKPSKINPGYAFQVATYVQLAPSASGEVRLDTLVNTKTPQLVTLPYRVSEADIRMTQTLYPHIQEGMREGRVFPNRNSTTCSRKYCPYWQECEAEFGGHVE